MRKLGVTYFDTVHVSSRAEYVAAQLAMAKRAFAAEGPSHHTVVMPDGSQWEAMATPRDAEEFYARCARRHADATQRRLANGEIPPPDEMHLLGYIEALLSIAPQVHRLEDQLEATRRDLESARRALELARSGVALPNIRRRR